VGSRWRKVLLAVGASQVVGWVVGQVISKRLSRGDEGSDEFRVVALMGGTRFHSHAGHLRSGTVDTWMGGVDLDLRHATLDPAGAVLDVRTTMGGVQVSVPDHWAVDVEQAGFGGGVAATVTPPDSLPPDAPRLQVRAVARMGGVAVTTGR
jgi:hypothetical protein